MLTWPFMAQVVLGHKYIPAVLTNESYVDLPNIPELSMPVLCTYIIMRIPQFRRLLPDVNLEKHHTRLRQLQQGLRKLSVKQLILFSIK